MDASVSWKLSTSSAAAWEDMLASCRRAEKTIDFEQYIFGCDGQISEEFFRLFREKAGKGVKVRLLLDAVGSFALYRSVGLCAELRKAGIEILFHKAILSPSLKRVLPVFLRDHRKLLVVDGKEAHIGGVIVAEDAREWRDTSVKLEGSGIVADCGAAFQSAWEHAKRMRPVGRVRSLSNKRRFFLAGNSFHLHDKDLYREFLRNIAAAKNTVRITTPYFSLTRDLRRALYHAKKKGVDIRILLPLRSDNLLADCLARLYYRRLLRRGIRLFQYSKAILHAKTITVDGKWASVGSCNFDWLSFRLNYELNVVGKDADFARELENIFHDDLNDAEEVTMKTSLFRGFFGR